MKLFSVFGKQLFGAHYESLKRSLMAALIVFWGVYLTEIKMNIAPSVLYLVCTTFPFGIMWHALSSNQNTDNLKGVLILPFEHREFVCSYVVTMCVYVLANKSSILLAVFWAVGKWKPFHIMGALLFAVTGCLVSMVLYTCRESCIKEILKGSFLKDAYAFYQPIKVKAVFYKRQKSGDMFLYIVRYLYTNKNCIINTAGLCGVAIVLPLMLQQFADMSVMPIGFGILSLNTPLCTLLSVDRDLQQAVKILPGQGMRFFLKYGCFLAGVNLFINYLFVLSWKLQCGGVDGLLVVLAIVFAIISAALSVAMEWLFPLQNWKLESDLYHHPRKYIIPSIMVLLAGIVMTILAR